MPTYINLINWTEEGIRNYKDSVDRAKAAEGLLAKHGGRFKDIYWTIGPYDLVAISEGPDDESMSAALLEVSQLGTIRSTTMRAFDSDEMAAVIAKTG